MIGSSAVAEVPATPPPGNGILKQQADTYFSQGEAAFEAGRYEESAAAFEKAYQTLPHHAVLANIGLAYERLGAYHLAVIYFRKYLSALGTEGKENPQIEAQLRESLSKVAEIVVSAEAFCARCRIYLDGEDKGVSPIHAVVLPGIHEIRVTSGGETRVSEMLNVSAGETKRYSVSRIKTPEVRVVIQMEQSGMGVPFWVAAASAIGCATASGALWGAAFKTKKSFDNETDLTEKARLKDRGEKYQTGAAITTGVTGAAVVTAVVLGLVRVISPKTVESADVSLAASRDGVGIRVWF